MHATFPLPCFSIIFVDNDDNVGMDDHDREIMGSVVTSFWALFAGSSGVYWFFLRGSEEKKMRDMRKSKERSNRPKEENYFVPNMYVVGKKGSDRKNENITLKEGEGVYDVFI